jgi:hypothetical protein
MLLLALARGSNREGQRCNPHHHFESQYSWSWFETSNDFMQVTSS